MTLAWFTPAQHRWAQSVLDLVAAARCHEVVAEHFRGGGNLKAIITRFRAYQLGSAGSSFSYFANGRFTLIEARLNDTNARSVTQEMANCGVETAHCLHITSWDSDHCSASELPVVLQTALPAKIECPGYDPASDNGRDSRTIIERYVSQKRNSNRQVELRYITPEYIAGLDAAEQLAFRDVLYNPRWLDENSANNNSTAKLFREGSFNVLSLGDLESHDISSRLRRDKYLGREVDVMILAHHGADNGFTNKRFLQHIEPQLAICSSNYDNQYEHPSQDLRELLHDHGIRLMTTKTGDIIAKSIGDHTGMFRAINLRAGSTEVSSQCDFKSKKARLLSYNVDTIRQLYSSRPSYRNL
jgi:competence protein ComEC